MRKRPASGTPHRQQAARSGFPLLLAAVVGTGILLSLTALPGRHPSPDNSGGRQEAERGSGLRTPESAPRSGAPLSRVSPGRTRTDRIVVRLRSPQPLEQLESRISQAAGFAGLRIEPHFRQSPTDLERARQEGEARTGRPLPDLNRYRRIELPAGTSADEANRLLEDLRRLDFVESAFVEPVAEPAALEDLDPDTPRGAGTETGLTPDYRPLQLYLRDAPVGLGATDVARYPGARGARVRLIDIEGDWNWAHEDLPAPFFQYGSPLDGWQNHGTAVLGELVGSSNGKGVEGIVPDLEVGAVSFSDLGVAAAIDLASSVLEEGDIILIELHAPGPNAPHGGGQFGYVPMEYWQDVFDAIRVATANGRIVVEAAGNGQQDLDDPVYGGLFDRQIRDSGAVLVAAGTPLGLTAEWFTNYGSRIDLHGWGTSIATTGYGTLHGGDQNRWYTSGFGGTSGASPMVCGAIASLQGMARASFGVGLDRDLAVELLRSTGSAFTGTKAIGPRPNLVAARDALIRGAAELHGVIRDAGSGAPLPDLPVLIDGDRWVCTDSPRLLPTLRCFPGSARKPPGSGTNRRCTRSIPAAGSVASTCR
ncbi:MAG: S8 family serine peptidase [Candidatus Eisenbacteria bacterium]